MISRSFLVLIATIAVVSGGTAQNNKPSAVDEVSRLAVTSSDFTAEIRAKFAKAFVDYCQEVLIALPTNTPTEDDWVASEQRTGNAEKILRLLSSKEYARSDLKKTFSDCKETALFLIQIQNIKEKRTDALANLEAEQFIALALNFNGSLGPYSSKLELNKDVKFALGDLFLEVLRGGLLKSATKALQDVQK
jgi:hypothetical protein